MLSRGGDASGGSALTVARVAPLVQAAAGSALDSPYACTALGIVHLLERRAKLARDVVLRVRPGQTAAAQLADAYAVRALAEVELGDAAQARRLLISALSIHPASRSGRGNLYPIVGMVLFLVSDERWIEAAPLIDLGMQALTAVLGSGGADGRDLKPPAIARFLGNYAWIAAVINAPTLRTPALTAAQAAFEVTNLPGMLHTVAPLRIDLGGRPGWSRPVLDGSRDAGS